MQGQRGWQRVKGAAALAHLQPEHHFSLAYLQHTQSAGCQGTLIMKCIYIKCVCVRCRGRPVGVCTYKHHLLSKLNGPASLCGWQTADASLDVFFFFHALLPLCVLVCVFANHLVLSTLPVRSLGTCCLRRRRSSVQTCARRCSSTAAAPWTGTGVRPVPPSTSS